jgi:hypothetical protein
MPLLPLYRSAALVRVYIAKQHKLECNRIAWGILITVTKPYATSIRLYGIL